MTSYCDKGITDVIVTVTQKNIEISRTTISYSMFTTYKIDTLY